MASGDLLDPTVVMVGVAVLVILITILLNFLLKPKAKSVLVVGLSESGKTTLFNRLTADSFTDTVMSIKENDGSVKIGSKAINLVALPGSVRLQTSFWDKFKGRARALIFVLDSVSFMSDAHNVADLLYEYLSDSHVSRNAVPVLVVCNKQDQTRAKSSQAISGQLEKEMGNIRVSRIGSLDSSGGGAGDSSIKILGNPNSAFRFADVKNKITFVNACSTDKTSDVKDITKWLSTHF